MLIASIRLGSVVLVKQRLILSMILNMLLVLLLVLLVVLLVVAFREGLGLTTTPP